MTLLKALPLLFLFPAMAQDFSKVEIKTIKVSKNIFMLQGLGGNIGVSTGNDGTFLIDDQFAPLHDKIMKAVKKISARPIRFVINTHWHGDHTGGNEALGKAGAVVVAHDNVRKRMSITNFSQVFKRKVPPSPKMALPVVTFPNRMSLHLNGEEVKIIHFGHAHTDGDAIVHFTKSNIFHLGDLFFHELYPYIDVDAGGSVDGMIRTVEKILKLVNHKTKIIPGHGPLASKQDLKNYLAMLKSVREKISGLMAQGKSLQEVNKMDPLKAFNKKWGKGFFKPETFTGIVYRSLKTSKTRP